jgi:hypothetical protein
METEFTFTSNLESVEICGLYPVRKELACLFAMLQTKIIKVETDKERRNLIIYTNKDNQRLEILRNDKFEMGSIKIEDQHIIF